jgi:ACS family tartrate transporter-like MFS transporter
MTTADDIEQRTMRKIMRRLVPLMALMFLVNFLDRVNLSFAALTMNEDLGLSPLDYAWGAGIFFIAYFLFEVPSNLIMERVGARLWMTRIMLSWGLVSASMALVQGPVSFMVVRFLLGAAEAGLVPGILLYITYWFPPRYRGRAIAGFLITAPLSFVIAGLLSVPILRMNGIAGLAGWQWMFIIEALPALLLAAAVFLLMDNVPREARWLDDAERSWLAAELRQEHEGPRGTFGEQVARLWDRRVAMLAGIYVGRTTAMYGISLFLPLIVKAMGMSNEQVGWVSTIPFVFATGGVVAWAYSSDRSNERHWHTIVTMVIAAIGLMAAARLGTSSAALIALALAAIGLYAQPVSFWALPPLMLSASAAVGGIAFINALGNLGGFVGPYLVGWTQSVTGDYSSGLYVLAAFAAVSAVLGVIMSRLNWERSAAPESPDS